MVTTYKLQVHSKVLQPALRTNVSLLLYVLLIYVLTIIIITIVTIPIPELHDIVQCDVCAQSLVVH